MRRQRTGGRRRLHKSTERPCHKLAPGECAVGEDLLDDQRRGDRAKHNPKREHGDAKRGLQTVERRCRVHELQRRIGHEIENALRDKRGDRPAQGPKKNADQVHEIAIANRAQRWNRHESDEQRRAHSQGKESLSGTRRPKTRAARRTGR
jgi:hypothetical protein